MSEVSFKNIELPLEQKLFFFYFISVDAHLWLICERATLYECYSNYEVIQSIMTYSRWSRVFADVHDQKVDVDDITHLKAVKCRERIKLYQREISQQTILLVHLLPFSNILSNKKKLTQLVVFPPKPFFVVIQVHLRQVLVRPIAPHPSVPTLPGQWKADNRFSLINKSSTKLKQFLKTRTRVFL